MVNTNLANNIQSGFIHVVEYGDGGLPVSVIVELGQQVVGYIIELMNDVSQEATM